MRKYNLNNNSYAVSEIVGAMVLILIAIASFSAIYMYVFPLPFQSESINVELAGFVEDDGYAFIKHMGGDRLNIYKVIIRDLNGNIILSEEYNNRWEIGGIFDNIPVLSNNSEKVHVMIFNIFEDRSEEIIFDGILIGNYIENNFNPYPYMLFTSLKTNTSGEDLLCFNHLIKDLYPNATRFVYNWLVNGNPIADVILTFDVNSSNFTRDYSGNGNNGSVVDAEWTSEGIVGGAYYFDGSLGHISFNQLPNILNAIYRNSFTISLWLKSDDITDNHRVIYEGCQDNENFVMIFQYNSQIHFAVRVNKGKKVDNVVRTYNLSSNVWYNIVCTWDAGLDESKIYVNGLLYDESNEGYRQYSLGSDDGTMEIGHGSSSSKYWLGYIDEFQIFNNVLSSEQIYQLYLLALFGNTDKSVVSSDESEIGDIWECIVIPTSSEQDYDPVNSNELEIINYGGGT
jgi:hypothetical protein